jgi:hypothetical protein
VGAAGGAARGEAAIAAAAAGVLEALQDATGRATARHKQLAANLKRTDDNLAGALEEAEHIRVRKGGCCCVGSFLGWKGTCCVCWRNRGEVVVVVVAVGVCSWGGRCCCCCCCWGAGGVAGCHWAGGGATQAASSEFEAHAGGGGGSWVREGPAAVGICGWGVSCRGEGLGTASRPPQACRDG